MLNFALRFSSSFFLSLHNITSVLCLSLNLRTTKLIQSRLKFCHSLFESSEKRQRQLMKTESLIVEGSCPEERLKSSNKPGSQCLWLRTSEGNLWNCLSLVRGVKKLLTTLKSLSFDSTSFKSHQENKDSEKMMVDLNVRTVIFTAYHWFSLLFMF